MSSALLDFDDIVALGFRRHPVRPYRLSDVAPSFALFRGAGPDLKMNARPPRCRVVVAGRAATSDVNLGRRAYRRYNLRSRLPVMHSCRPPRV